MITVKRTKQLNDELFLQVSRLWEKTGISNPERKDSLKKVQDNLSKTGVLILAKEDDNVVGTVWITNDLRRLYLHHMAVLPEKQNQGIGTMLMEECIALATEIGYQLKLEVNVNNSAAWHLYEKFGFKELSDYRVLIKRDI
ncbi:MAG TPA: GNAT family N-acetyltransferase [Candidatus Cloacimonas sp.]|nr:GNAT family N-acetyltransferase [Candidatus Cloacimonas sp.]